MPSKIIKRSQRSIGICLIYRDQLGVPVISDFLGQIYHLLRFLVKGSKNTFLFYEK